MSFNKEFLTELGKQKKLAGRELEVFIALFGEEKSRVQIAAKINVSTSVISSCLTGVYKKFKISARGPVKESRLKDWLKKKEETWQEKRKIIPNDLSSGSSTDNNSSFQRVREHCRHTINEQYSQIQLLSGETIGVDSLYVDVYLLDKPEHKLFRSPESILQAYNIEQDRYGMSRRIGNRVSAIEVANQKSKLIILGKPGSGKTTFLKHLAVDWYKGKFETNKIAVLIEIRSIKNKQWNLLEAINRKLGLSNGDRVSQLKKQIQSIEDEVLTAELQKKLDCEPLQYYLNEGKLLILLDGLDEAPSNSIRLDIEEQIFQISKEYPENKLIITCRTQIMQSKPLGFTFVEVAEFRNPQIEQFVRNWFIVTGESAKDAKIQWEKIDKAIIENPSLREFTATPILLTLLCLIVKDDREIPLNKNWLYEKGIKWLLSRWNEEKQIQDWQIGTETYRQLSIEDKEKLLLEIAASKFENPNNFVLFKTKELIDRITQQLNLSNCEEGTNILKAIEAQHGLLIQRADDLWSFSHLTFQEYFTVKWLTQLSSKELLQKIGNRKWQELVKQLVKSQQPSDQLLKLIKQAIDKSVKDEAELQTLLKWVLCKSKSIHTTYNQSAIRSFFYARILTPELDLVSSINHNVALSITLDNNLERIIYLDRSISRTIDRAVDTSRILSRVCTQDRINDLIRALDRAIDLTDSFSIALAFESLFGINITEELRALKSTLRNCLTDKLQWSAWIENLINLRKIYRDTNNNYQSINLDNINKEKFDSLYAHSKFIIDIINIRGAVSDRVRDDIEDSLLLPWEELQHRYPNICD